MVLWLFGVSFACLGDALTSHVKMETNNISFTAQSNIGFATKFCFEFFSKFCFEMFSEFCFDIFEIVTKFCFETSVCFFLVISAGTLLTC